MPSVYIPVKVRKSRTKKKFCKYGHDMSICGRYPDGHCVECRKISQNSEELMEYRRVYYEKHKKEQLEYSKNYRNTPVAIFAIYRYSAKVRNLPFTLELQDFENWCGKTSCHYCGEFIPTIGIDRIDNSPLIGYTKENIVACCSICNRFKMDLTVEEFKKQVKLIFHNFCEEK